MPGKPLDVVSLKSTVEAAMEALLRAADARVQWIQPSSPSDAEKHAQPRVMYSFLPAVYRSMEQHNHESIAPSDCDSGSVTLLLHGDNTFEYTWEMRRPAPRAMEYQVELAGDWSKPVLNRSRRGDEDQRVFLTTRRIRFQRLSNHDAESCSWGMTLRTLTRHGSDWAPVGQSERGVPPINMVFNCRDGGVLESSGAVAAAQLLNNSPACRVVAGLTKKVANKLGGPVDVMTDKWLPFKHVQLVACPNESMRVKLFNPLNCLAKALLQARVSAVLPQQDQDADARQRESPLVA